MKKQKTISLEEFYGAWIDQEQEREQKRLDRIGGFLKTIGWCGFVLPVIMPGENGGWVSFFLWFLVAFIWWIPFSWIGGSIARDW